MLKPLAMNRISLQVLREDAPAATLLLAEMGVFDPAPVEVSEETMSEFPAERYREVYASARARMEKIMARVDCRRATGAPRVISLDELEAVDERLGEIWREFSALEEQQRRVEDGLKSVDQLSATLRVFSDLQVDLSVLHSRTRFLQIRVGTILHHNLRQLEQAAALAGHLARAFHSVGDVDYVLVAGQDHSEANIEGLLKSADFRAVSIPPEFTGTPETVQERLTARRADLEREQADTAHQLEILGRAHEAELEEACERLRLATPYAALANRLRARGGLAVLQGWLPRAQVPVLRRVLEERLGRPHMLSAREPTAEERPSVPSVLVHSWLLRPFAALVRNYGVPRYGEVDPTVLFAVTFIAMFGMMFGDVGQGAVIALAGLLAHRRFPRFTPFVVSAGISSVFFGFMYGSVFGYEELIHPVWMAPLSDPMLMLTVALYWGIGFILVASALTVYNRLSEGRFAEALFDNRGVAGIAFYLAGLNAAFEWVGEGVLGGASLAAVLLPLAVILGYKWREQHGPLGERVLVVGVEGFESVMNYLANTLSFLRVAAFSMNHVALAIAVFTLADMMGTAGHWITVVLGNLFILVLEGAIVTIQVLRLEYYEGFSRFFSGDGREYRPLRLDMGAQPHP